VKIDTLLCVLPSEHLTYFAAKDLLEGMFLATNQMHIEFILALLCQSSSTFRPNKASTDHHHAFNFLALFLDCLLVSSVSQIVNLLGISSWNRRLLGLSSGCNQDLVVIHCLSSFHGNHLLVRMDRVNSILDEINFGICVEVRFSELEVFGITDG
jgi:hypothetical protein